MMLARVINENKQERTYYLYYSFFHRNNGHPTPCTERTEGEYDDDEEKE